MKPWVPRYSFRDAPVAYQFLRDKSFVSFAVGPVGSGKSFASLLKPVIIGAAQEAGKDGKRRTRGAVVRNTNPELRSTTMETYGLVYPEGACGRIVYTAPPTHHIEPVGSDMHVEVNFIALDKPADVKKLLSLELTWAFFNEAREIPQSIISRATERVGRYGVSDRPTTWSGIWGDYNTPDGDHYLHQWHKVETPDGFMFHQQPPAVLEVEEHRGGWAVIDENFAGLQGQVWREAKVRHPETGKLVTCPVEGINAAGRTWIVNPHAENLSNLWNVAINANPLGPIGYYGRSLAGKRIEEIRCYLQAVYVYVQDGRPVVPQYNDEAQSVDNLPILADEPIMVGMDIGGGTLQPSAVFFQRHPRGVYLVHDEVACFDLGVKRFGELVGARLQSRFPKHLEEGKLGPFFGDPAGEKRDEIFETASLDFLRATYGWNTRAAPSQDVRMRVAAIGGPCERMIDGRPGMLVHRRCSMLRKGLSGAWHYKRIQVTGEERYSDKPSKNDVSHVCDALSYGLLGAGEYGILGGRGANRKRPATVIAETEFTI